MPSVPVLLTPAAVSCDAVTDSSNLSPLKEHSSPEILKAGSLAELLEEKPSGVQLYIIIDCPGTAAIR